LLDKKKDLALPIYFIFFSYCQNMFEARNLSPIMPKKTLISLKNHKNRLALPPMPPTAQPPHYHYAILAFLTVCLNVTGSFKR